MVFHHSISRVSWSHVPVTLSHIHVRNACGIKARHCNHLCDKVVTTLSQHGNGSISGRLNKCRNTCMCCKHSINSFVIALSSHSTRLLAGYTAACCPVYRHWGTDVLSVCWLCVQNVSSHIHWYMYMYMCTGSATCKCARTHVHVHTYKYVYSYAGTCTHTHMYHHCHVHVCDVVLQKNHALDGWPLYHCVLVCLHWQLHNLARRL